MHNIIKEEIEVTELRTAKIHEIDAEAERRKAAAEYVIALIEANEESLKEAFIPEATSEEDVPELLYQGVTRTLQALEKDYLSAFGVRIRYMTAHEIDNEVPAVKLGWAKYHLMITPKTEDPVDKALPHTLVLTDSGKELINGLRAAQGQENLSDRRQRLRAKRKNF